MIKHNIPLLGALFTLAIACHLASSCVEDVKTTSSSGVDRKTTAVATDSSGWTTEQRNVAERLRVDNAPGAIKHLYVISPYSGQTILYSTVKGKVTSGGKRLSPNTVQSRYFSR